ncbi:response regulator [bacterium]|nr:response regulator [bacterium]
MQRLMTSALAKNGFEVDIAQDGRGCVLLALTRRPRAVLMDIQMPVLDGLRAVALFRKLESLRDIPILMLTALKSKDDVMEAIQRGAQDYVVKPIEDFKVVADKIQKLISKEARSDRPIYNNLSYRLSSERDILRFHLAETLTADAAADLDRLIESLSSLQPLKIEFDFQNVRDIAAGALAILSETRENILDDGGGADLTHFTYLKDKDIGRQLREIFSGPPRTGKKRRRA